MGTVQSWWRRLTGKTSGKPAPPARPAVRSKQQQPAGLELVNEPQKEKPGRVGAGGFDPYASDAGQAKPHSWERVDHD